MFLNCLMKIKYILVAQVSNVKHTHNVAIKNLCEPFVKEISTMCSWVNCHVQLLIDFISSILKFQCHSQALTAYIECPKNPTWKHLRLPILPTYIHNAQGTQLDNNNTLNLNGDENLNNGYKNYLGTHTKNAQLGNTN
jgi:hypothetical protein